MVSTVFNIFGGLAIFIIGMNMMSDGLHKAAGEKMRNILRLFSANRFVAILSGTAVTAVVQSSSASTVMVIGFVNAGLLTLVQAMGIIFGANIGTTVTAQLVAFDISWIVMPSIFLGMLAGFVRKDNWKNWGETLMGLGFLFLGMGIMSADLKSLSGSPAFMQAFQWFDCAPVNGSIPLFSLFGAILVGLVVTCIIQSSSACSGIVIALGASGVLNLYTAVALILGSNIGTTVTAQLAAISANRVAKQTALAHTLFNVIGALIISLTFYLPSGGDAPLFFELVEYLSKDGTLPRKIANAHTIFNVFTTVILIPFIPLLAKICEKLIPVKKSAERFQRLEVHLLDTPEIALTQTNTALRRMLTKAWRMVDCALKTYNKNDEENQKLVAELEEKEKRIDLYQHDITEYLTKLMNRPLTPKQSIRIPKLLHCTNDAERIGDHTAPICKMIEDFRAKGHALSNAAEEEFNTLHALLAQQAKIVLAVMEDATQESQTKAAKLWGEIYMSCDIYEKNHLARLEAGACDTTTGIFYIDLLTEIRKVARHFSNIAERAWDCQGK